MIRDYKYIADKLHEIAEQISNEEFLKCVVTTNNHLLEETGESDVNVKVVSNIGVLDFTFREDKS